MRRAYDVYTLGHALVDRQYVVSPEWLARHGVQKGVMTLVGPDRQAELRQALADQSPVAQASGGSAANTAIGVANLGGAPFHSGCVGDDDLGTFYLGDLTAAGVACRDRARLAGPTGQCLVFITPDADRTLNTFLGASASVGPDHVEAEAIAASRWVYLEGYLLSSADGLAACLEAQRQARAAGARVALTLSDPTMIAAFRPRFQAVVQAGVELVFGNLDEARAFTGETAAEPALTGLGMAAGGDVCVTCGAAGALVREGGQTRQVEGFPATAVDSTGAGDLFAGGVLFALTQGHSLAAAARLGCWAAAHIVAQYGPRLQQSLRQGAARLLNDGWEPKEPG